MQTIRNDQGLFEHQFIFFTHKYIFMTDMEPLEPSNYYSNITLKKQIKKSQGSNVAQFTPVVHNDS